ncbi:dynein [Amniculicola lignicola CBS 123094]|uniref:Dynein n=1 Tax=Amniculicola lignicola CBS 123094 TaxID=1392246 RepID=A0A6A5WAY7_9PLEO|nr:dynein [Amniculicola lignicola CBS 123094]
MTSSSRRASGFPLRTAGGHHRPGSSDQDVEEIWKPMLDNISSGKRLPEKSMLVLGGTPDTQREFLESISTDPSGTRRPPDRGRKAPIANQFALGYTYQDVLDSDHEDTLARLSLYLLAQPSPSFTPLIKSYLNPKTLPNMLVVILLDWNHPWLWVRQLRDWIRVLRSLIVSLDDASKEVLEENIMVLQDKGRGGASEASGANASDSVKMPLGQGEWDEPLGIPLCVVCQNADKIETLERERGWKEQEFDFILQTLRTILLKHGASLIYTMPTAPGSLQTLIHSALGIKSLLKQQQLKHNVIDRDRVLVPPNWDSWGKIRILREGFDVEGVSQKWSLDIDIPRHSPTTASGDAIPEEPTTPNNPSPTQEDHEPSATSIYEDTIRNPDSDFTLSLLHSKQAANGIEVSSKDTQVFLTEQLSTLEKLRLEDDNEAQIRQAKKKDDPGSRMFGTEVSGVVEEHIGPVQFNMGGIQVNADEMVRRLQDREANRTTSPEIPISPELPSDAKSENEKLASFFAGLANRGTGSTANSPRGA